MSYTFITGFVWGMVTAFMLMLVLRPSHPPKRKRTIRVNHGPIAPKKPPRTAQSQKKDGDDA